MRAGRNFIAGLASSTWSALLGLAVVPLYLRYLGLEAYGLIGFFATMQALFQILDMGLAPTVNREIARSSVSGHWQGARDLLRTLAVIYWLMAGAITLLMVLLGPVIAGYWLTPKSLPPATVAHAVMLMGLVVACRWPVALYQGVLVGREALTTSSTISICMTSFASLGAVAILALVSPTIEAFFLWQAFAGLCYALVMRRWAWRAVGGSGGSAFKLAEVRRIMPFALSMGGVALSGVIFMQLDKILLSKLIPLEQFALYALATLVASGLYVLIIPLFNVIYPRFSTLVAAGNERELIRSYRVGTRLSAIVLFPIAIVLGLFAEDLVRMWTGNAVIAHGVAPLIALLALGSALHGVMYFPFALQLAYGMPSLSLKINVILMVILVPLTFFLARTYGAVGGAAAWLVLHVLYVMLGTWMTHRRLLPGTGRKWLLGDVGIPLCISLLVIGLGRAVPQLDRFTALTRVTAGGAMALVAAALALLASPAAYDFVSARLPWRTH